MEIDLLNITFLEPIHFPYNPPRAQDLAWKLPVQIARKTLRPPQLHQIPLAMTYDNNPNAKPGNNMSSSDSNTDDIEVGRYGPLAHINTAESRVPAFGGEFQPGLYRSPRDRKIANPAPLGLCGFALTTFMLGCIQMNVRGITQPNIIVGPALAYGGLVQLLSGMWCVTEHLTPQSWRV